MNGRIKVRSDGSTETRVYVVPDEGDEIHLPVRAVEVHSHTGEAVIGKLELYVCEFDVVGVDPDGNEQRFVAKGDTRQRVAVHPHVVPQVRDLLWRYTVGQPRARVEVTE